MGLARRGLGICSGARRLSLAAGLCLAALPALASPHALLIEDANSGAILINQDGDEPRHPASLTKMMTLYLVFEALEKGSLSMSTRIKVSEHAANAAPSKLELAPGDDISLEDGILALITKSANDVAVAVAEHIGGSESNFAQIMTAKARELGMRNTVFRNASGLPDAAQITTARDMVTLGLHLYDDFPRYFPLFGTKSFSYNGSTFKNHNTLMLQMPGINGIKTGYTAGSGFNLVSSFEADGKHLVGAIFGGETATLRNVEMRVALSKALTRASSVKSRKPALVARARKKSVPAPTLAVRKPVQVPPAAIATQALPARAPVPASSTEGSAAAAPSPLRIDVAKVKTVPVPMRAQEHKAADSPATATVAQSEPPRQPSGRPASTFETHMAGLARTIVATPAEAAPAATEADGVPPAAAARPPSTLNAQLAALVPAQAPLQPTYRLKGPVQDANATAAGGYEVQIGAYASPADAQRSLAAAAAKFPVLAGHAPTHQSVNAGGKTLYRARFVGFDAAAAAKACGDLKQAGAACLAVKAD